MPTPEQNSRVAPRPTSASPSSHTLQALLSMGFPEREAQEAASRSQTLEQAIDYITNR